MTRRTKTTQLYRRNDRWYADLRSYADVGGRQESLTPAGERRATTDYATAVKLHADRLRELEAARKDRTLHGLRRRATLAEYVSHHLVEKAKAGKVTTGWLSAEQTFLEKAVASFGTEHPLHTITVTDCTRWLSSLRDDGLKPGTQRAHLNSLSNLYRRAQSEEVVPPGYNPVAAMLDKPTGQAEEARWLETSDAALLLEAARRFVLPTTGRPAGPAYAVAYPLVATFLLTGGRAAEVLGLEVGDVSFDRGTVTFRPNAFRRLKTKGSARVVPLWPQLAEILRPYMDRRVVERGGTLLFPGTDATHRATSLNWLLDAIGKRAGWKTGEIRSRAFRNTYCAARLQTLDHGAPVAVWTVSRELGHSSTSLVEKVYGHLGTIRHRSEVVEYRIEQHEQALAERLAALS